MRAMVGTMMMVAPVDNYAVNWKQRDFPAAVGRIAKTSRAAKEAMMISN